MCKDNGYSPQQIWQALKPATWTTKTNKRPTLIAFIIYTQTAYGWLSIMLAKHNIKSVSLLARKIYSYLPSVKDVLGLRMLCVYSIPCECGQVCIGQSSQSIQIRIKEHNRHIWLAQTDKSTAAEPRIILLNYRIQNFFLQNLDTWTNSSGKPLNWKCTHTTWIEKMDWL